MVFVDVVTVDVFVLNPEKDKFYIEHSHCVAVIHGAEQ